MDVDNENFYDNMSSFIAPASEYSLEDLDEIIRSTGTNLDASLDLTAVSDFDLSSTPFELPITAATSCSSLDISNCSLQPHMQDEFHFNFNAFPSPASTHLSDSISSHEISARTSSTSSMDGEHFNADDFFNFLNDDDIKMDDLIRINTSEGQRRHTPSPTGSYASSSGSSTSGIQSDVSMTSAHENIQQIKHETGEEFELVTKPLLNLKETAAAIRTEQKVENNFACFHKEDAKEFKTEIIKDNKLATTPSALINVAIPVKTINTMVVPLRKSSVPVESIKPCTNVKADEIRSTSAAIPASKVIHTTTPSPKLNPPSNPKPKTIYLSSNDFKVLMQKMNSNNNNNNNINNGANKKFSATNGQMPKVVLKTTNGKIIPANKIFNNTTGNANITATTSPPIHNQFKANIVKASGAHAIKQNLNAQARANLMANGNRLSGGAQLKGGNGNFDAYKDLIDEKLFKKQQRMLKNRESASLSRRKKKEYMERLENRIKGLEKENYTLKGENSSLRSQLIAFAQTCQCKNANVSEFILNSLQINTEAKATVLSAIDSAFLLNNKVNKQTQPEQPFRGSTNHIKIAPKPPNAPPNINRNFKQRMSATTVKKNVAILFAMAFMVTLNVGNFQHYLNKAGLENSALESIAATGEEQQLLPSGGRRLLWVPTEQEFHEQNNRSKREIEFTKMAPPPLHFLRPINRTTADKLNGTAPQDDPLLKKSEKCASSASSNTTNYIQENMRLARNLHKWIGGNDYLNLSSGRNLDNVSHFKLTRNYVNLDLPLQDPVGNKPQKRKIFMDNTAIPSNKKAKLANLPSGFNSLELFKPRISEEYLRLFKGIKRQDDTFYVLSFNMDHILLPASAYNKTSRPKMSLMLPAGDPSLNGDVVLMQIDCEVINTTELEIKSHMIPEKLRRSRYDSVKVKVNDDVVNNGTNVDEKFEKKSKNPEKNETKEKSRTTYFMMGPKNQNGIVKTDSNEGLTMKRRPPLLKLNASDSILGSGILNVRNSTLFSKMKETVVNAGVATTSDPNFNKIF
uniref:BZIP domain-containing protein n=1 Tax=Glossina palpalis gambiensis TaxID=67801 RepID=A0A1B0AMC5_9MUSC